MNKQDKQLILDKIDANADALVRDLESLKAYRQIGLDKEKPPMILIVWIAQECEDLAEYLQKYLNDNFEIDNEES